jgi:hypothetical protein
VKPHPNDVHANRRSVLEWSLRSGMLAQRRSV